MLVFPFLLGILRNVNGVAIDNSVEGEPTVECLEDEIKFSVQTRKLFGGRIFAKGKVEVEECMSAVFAQERTDAPSISLPLGSCGMESLESSDPRGMYYGITIVVSFHPLFLTKVDQAYHTRCFFEEAERGLKAELGVSMIPTTMTNAVHGVGGCKYTIHEGTLGDVSVSEGPEIQFARIGDSVMHKWSCSDGMMGVLIKNCHVTDGMGQRAEVIDSIGCPVDPILVSGIRYSSDLNEAFAESHVFKFADRPGLWFFCEVQMCMKSAGHCDGLTPPRCGSDPSVSPVGLYIKDSVADVNIELTADEPAHVRRSEKTHEPDDSFTTDEFTRSQTHTAPTAIPTRIATRGKSNIRRRPPNFSAPTTLDTTNVDFPSELLPSPTQQIEAAETSPFRNSAPKTSQATEIVGLPPGFVPVQPIPTFDQPPPEHQIPAFPVPNDSFEDEYPGVPLDAFKGPTRFSEPPPTVPLRPEEQVSLFGPIPQAPPIGVIFEAHDYIGNTASQNLALHGNVTQNAKTKTAISPTAIVSEATKRVPITEKRRGKASISLIPDFVASGGQKTVNLRPDGSLKSVTNAGRAGQTTLPPYRREQSMTHKIGPSFLPTHGNEEPLNIDDIETTGEIAGQLIVYDLDEEVPSFLRSSNHELHPFDLSAGDSQDGSTRNSGDSSTSGGHAADTSDSSTCPVDGRTFQGIVIGCSTAISVLLFTSICLYRRAARNKNETDVLMSYRDINGVRGNETRQHSSSRVRCSATEDMIEAQRSNNRKSRYR